MRQTSISIKTVLRTAGAAAALMLAAIVGMPSAQAANPLELNFYLSGPRYDGHLPACEAALGTISAQFAEKEGKFWNSAMQITGYSDVREVAFRPWASEAIPRRFCAARAMLNNGRLHTVRYSIIEDGGFAGFGVGVEWCVVGFDRNWAYNPACRGARP